MNSTQIMIAGVALVVWTMSVLTLPYSFEDNSNSSERSAGFHLFTTPPRVQSYAEMQKIFSIPDD